MSILTILLNNMIAKWWTLPLLQKDLTGRTVIVTGSNVGLGLEAARYFYAMNPARLILAVRSVEKGETARQSILNNAKGTNSTKIEVWDLDLSNFDSVKQFAKRCNEELDRLDVFLSNAAMATDKFSLTKEGYEPSIQTNVISTYLLSALILPLLTKTARLPAPVQGVKLKPHLAIVTSDVHFIAQFPEGNAPDIYKALNDQSTFNGGDRYPTTKLMDLLLARQLSQSSAIKRGVDGDEIVVCAVNPGFCRSELMREAPWLQRQILYTLFASTTEEGAKNFVWASLEDNIPPGSYISSCTVAEHAKWIDEARGAQVQSRLWKETGDILKKLAPETESVWKL